MLGGARQGVKKPFFSKKCIFWPENDVFSKKSFYKKLISDQNYIMCTCQKKDFLNKVMRLQFSPDSTYPWQEDFETRSLCLFLFAFSWWKISLRFPAPWNKEKIKDYLISDSSLQSGVCHLQVSDEENLCRQLDCTQTREMF